jgi:hypothetical protein
MSTHASGARRPGSCVSTPIVCCNRGRQLLREWIAQIPIEQVDDDPWLLHWFGLAQVGVDPAWPGQCWNGAARKPQRWAIACAAHSRSPE